MHSRPLLLQQFFLHAGGVETLPLFVRVLTFSKTHFSLSVELQLIIQVNILRNGVPSDKLKLIGHHE
jgi:hypothetical protein